MTDLLSTMGWRIIGGKKCASGGTDLIDCTGEGDLLVRVYKVIAKMIWGGQT